jgi:hypothetical protein
MTSTYPIVGLHDGLGVESIGSIPIRYEFNSFVDPLRNRYASDQLNLFLQALERMQKAPKEEVTSWFQVGGERAICATATKNTKRVFGDGCTSR